MTSNPSRDDRIRGKVAQLANRRELLINRGYADGVELGMRFAILNRNTVDVKDPDTGEVLESVGLAKTIVKVVRLEGPHLCTARTFRTIKGKPGLGLGASFIFGPTADVVETLETNGASLKEELSEADSLVKIGDPAVQTIGDEYDDGEW